MKWVTSFLKFSLTIFSLVVLSSSLLFADDIDIFDTEKPTEPPNILFIMDVSGSMKWDINSSTEPSDPADSRLSILKNALATFLNDPEMVDVNVGLSRYAGDTTIADVSQTAHGISYPVSPIDSDADTILDSNPEFDHPGTSYLPATGGITSRGYLQTIANNWIAFGGTPFVDSLFEAALYFRGDETNWGRHDPSKIRSAHPSTYTGLLKDVATTTTEYKCITESCSGAACNATKSCSTTAQTNYCDTATCGTSCTGPSAVRQTCGESETSCGNGTNCVSQALGTEIRNCITNIAWLCQIVNPTWYDCNSVTNTSCTTTCPAGEYDEFGSCTDPVQNCNTSQNQQCKEDVNRFICDADQFQCTTDIESCSHEVCGNFTTTTTELIGSAKFISPIKNECSSNAIVMLSDGLPSLSLSASLISQAIGSSYANNCDTGTDAGRCGKELAKYMANEDVNPSIDGDQFVNTYTIGFALGSNPEATEYLQTLAEAGGGSFAPASSVETLVKAFKDAVSGVNNKARSFSSPTYSTNSNSILSHGDYVYLPVFNRETGPHWSGNLKKFKTINGRLVDKDNHSKLATSASGALNTAKDEWATDDIVHPVKDGGAASKLNPDTRVVYTDNGSNGQSASLVTLNASNVSNSQLGISGGGDDDDDDDTSSTEKNKLIDFIKGKNADGTHRHHMGDIIHGKPVHLEIDGHNYIFVGTNEGYLHAFKDDGTEVFAYMPSELLKNIKKQKDNTLSDFHIYGVDSEITAWKGKVGSDYKTYLLFGLRRGGKAYYALDVTNPLSPTLAWRINSDTTGFENLGYTWSKPKTAKVRVNASVTKNVMIVGGGYVDDNGIEGTVEADNSGTGADVFIVDIATGAKVWKASDMSSLLDYAIPGSVRTLDIDRNGLMDRLYFADTGGYIWRVDLDYSHNIQEAKLYPFADLGVQSLGSSRRKFFNEPDVAFFRHAGQYVISVAIGSGDRPNALDEATDDRFFALFDNHPFKYSSGETVDLDEITIKEVDLTSAATAKDYDLIKNSRPYKGWFLDFNNHTNSSGVAGEKVLSSAFTYENKVIFTSFGKGAITTDPNDSCKTTSANQSHLYVLNLLDAKPPLNIDDDPEKETFVGPLEDIQDTPQIHRPSPEKCTVKDCSINSLITSGVALPVETPRLNTKLPRVFWLDKQ